MLAHETYRLDAEVCAVRIDGGTSGGIVYLSPESVLGSAGRVRDPRANGGVMQRDAVWRL